MHNLTTLNERIFWILYGITHKSAWLDLSIIFLADYLPYVLGAIFLALFLYPQAKRKQNQLMIIFASFSALFARVIVKTFILLFVSESRPFVILNRVKPLITTALSENIQSFPSGHTIFFFAFAMAVWLFDKKWGAIAFIAAIFIGIARISAGVHWPVDVLAGALLGMLTSWVLYKIAVHYWPRS